jgi:alginate O-acetyltransferase complex protein AlgI
VSISTLLIIICASLLLGLIATGKWRSWALLVASIFVIYWLQPASSVRHLDYWLPTACMLFTILTWILTRKRDSPDLHSEISTGLVIASVILFIGFTRYLGPLCCVTPTSPPQLYQIAVAIIAISLVAVIFAHFGSSRTAWIFTGITLIIAVFVVLKSEPLAVLASQGLRLLNGQSVELASVTDIQWLGFSYVAFRLIHTLRDRISGRLPDIGLRDYVTYVIFFPAFSAGPIDRVQHFTQELHQPFKPSMQTTLQGGMRILWGVFSKFVLADGLALIALNNSNAGQVTSSGWLWVILYAYALRIFFDFSGYTHIAIGLGQILGIQLPENFDRPYLKRNLTLFWNSWHITLAQWFRAYFFNPLTRTMRSSQRNISLPLIIFIGQLSTFTLIGLWHGISWNFAIWGAWHGIGLFIHNRWSNLVHAGTPVTEAHSNLNRLLGLGGTFLTFQYVSLGWVWFALSNPAQSWHTLLKLFGIR